MTGKGRATAHTQGQPFIQFTFHNFSQNTFTLSFKRLKTSKASICAILLWPGGDGAGTGQDTGRIQEQKHVPPASTNTTGRGYWWRRRLDTWLPGLNMVPLANSLKLASFICDVVSMFQPIFYISMRTLVKKCYYGGKGGWATMASAKRRSKC